jgi:hypothetical protein
MWDGHVMQMDNNPTTKRMFNTRPEGKTRTRKPKLLLGDSVDHENRILGNKI